MNSAVSYLKTASFTASDSIIQREPFPFLIARDTLNEQHKAGLHQDFPVYSEAGYLPYNPSECGPSINKLIEEITSSAIADELGVKLGIERLSQYPTLVTICRHLNRRHGSIHTDGRSKVATALIYMNDEWAGTSDGCLRFLASADDVNDTIAPEVAPLFGRFAMFKRADNSYHGHLPYEGERRVIQIAWIINEAERNRKLKRGGFSRFIKGIFGGLDKKLGANRI